MSVPVHANRMKLYFDPSDRPVCEPSSIETSPDLSDSDLPPDSFESTTPSNRVRPNADSKVKTVTRRVTDLPITRPEDSHTPAQIVPVP